MLPVSVDHLFEVSRHFDSVLLFSLIHFPCNVVLLFAIKISYCAEALWGDNTSIG